MGIEQEDIFLEQVGCGYCALEMVCAKKVAGRNLAKEGCEDFNHWSKDVTVLAKPNYLNKDGVRKRGFEINGVYYAQNADLENGSRDV